MEIRTLRPEERVQYERLSSLCFSFTIDEKKDREKWDATSADYMHRYLGAFDDKGRLMSAMQLLPMTCRLGGQEAKLLGIGGVTTDPCDRRNGAIHEIFRQGLTRAHREGYVLSALYPFSHAFYRQFGYELCALRRWAELDCTELRRDLRPADRIVRVLPEDAAGNAQIKQVYELWSWERDLAVVRGDEQWEKLLGGDPFTQRKYAYLFLDAQDQPMAYWLGAMEEKGDDTRLRLTDMAWTKPEGLQAIFAMLRKCNEFGRIRFRVPDGVESRMLIAEPWHVSETTTCGGMLRVLDVRRAAAMLAAPVLPGSFTVRVQDALLPENDGVFKLCGDGHEITVEDGEEAEVALAADIGTFTALLLGFMTPAEAADMGKCRLVRENAFMKLLLCRRETFLHDGF